MSAKDAEANGASRRAKVPVASRYASMLMALAALLHALVASDLLLQFLPPTPEIQSLWAVGAPVKALWVAFVFIAVATAVVVRRAPVFGFSLSCAATLCLYFASVGLWHGVKGGFWIVVLATVLAAYGAWRVKRSDKSS
jgi:hypothetical protein